jgi:hypothetical protein
MNSEQFLDELGTVFDKHPKPQQLGIYRDKLRRFSPEQLLELLNKVLEEAKYFPKVSEIYKAANELGYLSIDTTKTRHHHWQPSKCGLCCGEGRLALFWEFRQEQRETGIVEIQRVVKIAQYTNSLGDAVPQNQFRTIFRCECAAGDVMTLPKAWPKYNGRMPSQREVWA